MSDATASLAQAITWRGSKQSYFTARLMVDRELVDDFFRAYAYFRWADDVIDAPASAEEVDLTRGERVGFISRQQALIDRLYQDDRPAQLTGEEAILADLIGHDRGENSGLQSFIRNMMTIIAFDAERRGKLIDKMELAWYSDHVARSVTDGIEYFIGNRNDYPDAHNRLSAALGAHITHLLRDMVPDAADGFINIPREVLEATGASLQAIDSAPFRAWVRERVELARNYFQEGKAYLDQLEVLRCKIVGHWYCARFEKVLDAIEDDDYLLRDAYHERRNLSTWLKIGWLALSVTLKHIAGRRRPGGRGLASLGQGDG